ncbi:hypothetical protein GALMADRAFT_146424 [Galerina marginata CBS 339.88]|uniref:Uncharacterized protein n=1 Tax=Galerina marginata (strain CBS 339.88) TaxID=685588 RepID=A0A067SP02_GALM3|nr:hypothetical protein GALMADRAFT_146424 [Galerina marginata CBS 339.88]
MPPTSLHNHIAPLRPELITNPAAFSISSPHGYFLHLGRDPENPTIQLAHIQLPGATLIYHRNGHTMNSDGFAHICFHSLGTDGRVHEMAARQVTGHDSDSDDTMGGAEVTDPPDRTQPPDPRPDLDSSSPPTISVRPPHDAPQQHHGPHPHNREPPRVPSLPPALANQGPWRFIGPDDPEFPSQHIATWENLHSSTPPTAYAAS